MFVHPTFQSMTVRLGALAALALLLLTVTSAFGHARFIESDPMPDAVVTAPPSSVTIFFGEILEFQGNTIKVWAADGTQLDMGDVTLLDGNHKAMWVSLPPNLPAGTYRVTWANVSAEDGHDASGEFSFTVAPAASDDASDELLALAVGGTEAE